jgi:K+-transporting ATPase ATPase C chain
MLPQLRISALMLVTMTVLTGVVYPLAGTLIAQAVFPFQANGSILENEGSAVGSELIGQSFSDPRYFWGRLSATAPFPYNAAASGGSNFGPLNPELEKAAAARIATLRTANSDSKPVPVDLVTASGSGLDPHLSPAAAEFQVPRVAVSRRMSERDVRELLQQHTELRQFGLLGEPRVHILRLNLALDRISSAQAER